MSKCLLSRRFLFGGAVAVVGMAGASLWATALAVGGATSRPYSYRGDKVDFDGLITEPSGKDAIRGGVLVVHNWMGVSDETKKQAERFADLGFVVLSADIYGKGVRPKGPEEAGRMASKYKGDRQLFRRRLTLALDELRKQPSLKGKPLFAAGYCFGGTGVIELARTGADVDGVLSFHGGLDSPAPAEVGRIKARVVAFHGADDPYVPVAELAAFEKEMATNKVDWLLVKFGGAVHSFTDLGAGHDPSKGAAYNAKADSRSWEMTRHMLDEWTASGP